MDAITIERFRENCSSSLFKVFAFGYLPVALGQDNYSMVRVSRLFLIRNTLDIYELRNSVDL